MTREPIDRLRDARHFGIEAQRIVLGMNSDLFEGVSDYHYAMRYCLLAIGEALRNVPAELHTAAPAIPWRAIIAMRHRLAHDYWLVDSRMVLEAGERHSQALIDELDRLIALVTRDIP